MECPKCSGEVKSRESATFFLLCTNCKGVWIDRDKLTNYLREHHEEHGFSNPPQIHHETWPVQTELSCPSCEESKLERVRIRGVEAERCRLCKGVFFDHLELERVAARSLNAAKALEKVRTTPPKHKQGWSPDADDIFDLVKSLVGRGFFPG